MQSGRGQPPWFTLPGARNRAPRRSGSRANVCSRQPVPQSYTRRPSRQMVSRWMVVAVIAALSRTTASPPKPKATATSPHRRAWCHAEGCDRRSKYAENGGAGPARFCPRHREASHGPIYKGGLCRTEGCSRAASFASKGQAATCCLAHRRPQHINVVAKTCEAPRCHTLPSFAAAGSARGRFCAAHRAPGDVNVVSRRCGHKGCWSQAIFGRKGKTPIACGVHKAQDHVDLKSRMCKHPEGCPAAALFGPKEGGGAELCAAHRNPSDLNLKVRRCAHALGCTRQPSFGAPGDDFTLYASRYTERFCKEHRGEEHVDLKHAVCVKSSCGKQAANSSSLCPIHARRAQQHSAERDSDSDSGSSSHSNHRDSGPDFPGIRALVDSDSGE